MSKELSPPAKPPTCDHAAPTFGCAGCIGRDRRAEVEAIIKHTGPPMCDCGLAMKAGESSMDGERIRIEYACQDEDCDESAILWSDKGVPSWEFGT